MTKKRAEYKQPDKARIIELYRNGKSLMDIVNDQGSKIQEIYWILREAWFDGKL